MNIGIILAAGQGQRFGSNLPKQFSLLNDKMIIDYSIETFESIKNINKIIIVTPQEWVDKISKLYPKHLVIKGGATRQESSFSALKKCPKNTKNVLIHDSARPFISKSIINKCLLSLKNNSAVIVSKKSTDTIIRVKNGKIIKIEKREELFLNQTPQAFEYKIILNAHIKKTAIATDDFSLLKINDIKCKIIEGPNYNIKITTEQDLKIAEALLHNL